MIVFIISLYLLYPSLSSKHTCGNRQVKMDVKFTIILKIVPVDRRASESERESEGREKIEA